MIEMKRPSTWIAAFIFLVVVIIAILI